MLINPKQSLKANIMTIVPVKSSDLNSSEISWFSALCSDDYQFLGVPDGNLRSSWDHCSKIVTEAEKQKFHLNLDLMI